MPMMTAMVIRQIPRRRVLLVTLGLLAAAVLLLRALMPALLQLQVEIGWMDEAALAPLRDIAEPPRLGRTGQVVGCIRVAARDH